MYRVELEVGTVAVKVPKNKVTIGSKAYVDMLTEAEFLSKLRHTNITLLLGYGTHSTGSIAYVMEFAESSLAELLAKGPLERNRFMELSHGIIRGLLYLHIHTPPITHRDLKPENVLIIKGVAKLADFGLATARDVVTKSSGFAGTPVWSAPETFSGKFTGPASDIYSFGLLLWSMTTGKTPYQEATFNEILTIKAKNQLPDIPANCSPEISKIIKKCLKANPKQRPTAPILEVSYSELRHI